MMIGSCAIQKRELRQVREEAAVSGTSGCAASLPGLSILCMRRLYLSVEGRCAVYIKKARSILVFLLSFSGISFCPGFGYNL